MVPERRLPGGSTIGDGIGAGTGVGAAGAGGDGIGDGIGGGGAGGGGAGGVMARGEVGSTAPHAPQKTSSACNDAPHDPQNFMGRIVNQAPRWRRVGRCTVASDRGAWSGVAVHRWRWSTHGEPLPNGGWNSPLTWENAGVESAL